MQAVEFIRIVVRQPYSGRSETQVRYAQRRIGRRARGNAGDAAAHTVRSCQLRNVPIDIRQLSHLSRAGLSPLLDTKPSHSSSLPDPTRRDFILSVQDQFLVSANGQVISIRLLRTVRICASLGLAN